MALRTACRPVQNKAPPAADQAALDRALASRAAWDLQSVGGAGSARAPGTQRTETPMNVSDLKGQTIAFPASGGLDSRTITSWRSEQGVRVVCFTADMAQPDEPDFGAIRQRMLACGAADFVAVPLQQAIAEAGIAAIQAQSCYEGRYWNTTGIG